MNEYLQEIINTAKPLEDKQGIGPLVASLKDKKIVMLGEASHGTQEFYEWRQHITQELIMNHGFSFVSVEGDWPSCQNVSHHVKGKSKTTTREALSSFKRWPTWMWANHEVLGFIDWLKAWNEKSHTQVGFHGLDVYSFYESMDSVISTLKRVDPELAQFAKEKYSCLEAYRHDEIAYAKSLLKAPAGCQKEIIDVLNSTLKAKFNKLDDDAWFEIKQNATIVKNAEDYYRTMVFGNEDSWNVRDTHMMSTLEMLINNYGKRSKAIVWAHNTHIGDYRATDMVMRNQINIGGLAREIFGNESVALVGFGTYAGKVIASSSWDGATNVFDIPEAHRDSIEHACHSAIAKVASENFYLIFDPLNHHSPLNQVKPHRAIGVVYDPDIEHRGNYVPTSLANRYDAFVFLDHTHALNPLIVPFDKKKFPETYPYGARI